MEVVSRYARPCVAQRVWHFLTSHVVEPHSYGSDLAPCDIFLFLTGKRDLKGSHFESSQAVLGAAETVFKHLVRNRFQHVFD